MLRILHNTTQYPTLPQPPQLGHLHLLKKEVWVTAKGTRAHTKSWTMGVLPLLPHSQNDSCLWLTLDLR